MTEVKAPITGNVWKVLVKSGQGVKEGETLVILEAMKMEIPIDAPCDGIVDQVAVAEGGQITEGNLVLTLK